MMGKDQLILSFMNDANDLQVETMGLSFAIHLSELDFKNKQEVIKYVSAILNKDLIEASGYANPEEKKEFMERREKLVAAISNVIIGHKLSNVDSKNVAKTAATAVEVGNMAKNGKANVNGRELNFTDESKFVELARRFVEVLSHGKEAVMNALTKVKECAKELRVFLKIKVKEQSEKMKVLVEKLKKKAEVKIEALKQKANLEPSKGKKVALEH